MAEALTGRRVLELAMAVEDAERALYESLYRANGRTEVREFCVRASHDEIRHYGHLQRLYDKWPDLCISGRASLDGDSDCVRAARRIIPPECEGTQKVDAGEDPESALGRVLETKADAIRFYEGVIGALPEMRSLMEVILAEELGHLRGLEMLQIRDQAA